MGRGRRRGRPCDPPLTPHCRRNRARASGQLRPGSHPQRHRPVAPSISAMRALGSAVNAAKNAWLKIQTINRQNSQRFYRLNGRQIRALIRGGHPGGTWNCIDDLVAARRSTRPRWRQPQEQKDPDGQGGLVRAAVLHRGRARVRRGGEDDQRAQPGEQAYPGCGPADGDQHSVARRVDVAVQVAGIRWRRWFDHTQIIAPVGRKGGPSRGGGSPRSSLLHSLGEGVSTPWARSGSLSREGQDQGLLRRRAP